MASFPRSAESCLKCSMKLFIGYLLIQGVFMLIYTHFIIQRNIDSSNAAVRSGNHHHSHKFHLQKEIEGWDLQGPIDAEDESLGSSGELLKKAKPTKPKIFLKHRNKIVEIKRKRMKITTKKNNSSNYMENADRVLALPLLINTTHCKIPDFKPIDEETQPLMKRLTPPDCPKMARPSGSRWNSKIDGKNRLIVIPPPDYDLLYNKNGSLREDSIGHCCYQIITRATDDVGEVEVKKTRDFLVDLTPCATIKPNVPTEIRAEFIKVECYNNRVTTGFENGAKNDASSLNPQLEYREFHAIITPHRNPRRGKILKKQNFWTKVSTQNTSSGVPDPPPNILIIAHDCTSRLHFRRQMNRTLAYLQDKNAIEFLGYTRVAENTFPNLIPLLTGYDADTYQDICADGSVYKNYQDGCPFIWKEFNTANYLTAFLEDRPLIGTFQYKRPGFFEQPVDFSLRPVLLQDPIETYTCVGSRTNNQFILAYIKKLLKFSHLRKVPHFTFSFSTGTTHDDFNGLQTTDEEYAAFFEEIEKKGYLKNTILFVLSDHGYRYGPIKQTIVGGYEENLPNFWVLLGPEVKEKYPNWEKTLKINAKRLTSPYNLYSTLRHILRTVSSVSTNPKNPTKVGRKVTASSLLNEVKEDSTCSDIGVEDQFCSCGLKRSLPPEDELTQAAGKFALAHLNKELNKLEVCVELNIRRIVGALIKEPNKKNETLVIVSLVLLPGWIRAEATLHVKLGKKKFEILDLAHFQRINKMYKDCFVDNQKVEKFCHCPPRGRRSKVENVFKNNTTY